MTIQDEIVRSTGFPVNDGLAVHFGKTADESLQDAERRWLISEGGSGGTNQDMWKELFGELFGLGEHINEIKLAYWKTQGPDPADDPIHILVVGQFSNPAKRGYRVNTYGSYDPPPSIDEFQVSELFLKTDNNKIKLRGYGDFVSIQLGNDIYLKADANYDGDDTWKWPAKPAQAAWQIGDEVVVEFSG